MQQFSLDLQQSSESYIPTLLGEKAACEEALSQAARRGKISLITKNDATGCYNSTRKSERHLALCCCLLTGSPRNLRIDFLCLTSEPFPYLCRSRSRNIHTAFLPFWNFHLAKYRSLSAPADLIRASEPYSCKARVKNHYIITVCFIDFKHFPIIIAASAQILHPLSP